MKIMAKLLTAFLGVAFICGVIGTFAIGMIGSLDSTIMEMNTKTIPSIAYLDTISKEFRTILGTVQNLANPRGGYTPGYIDEQLAAIDASRAKYRPVMDLYDALPKTAEEQILWNAVKDTLTSGAAYTNTTVELTKKVLSLPTAEEIEAQYDQVNAHVFGPDRKAFTTLFDNLEKNVAYVSDYYGTQMALKANKTGDFAKASMVAITLAGLALAVALGIIFGNSMSATVKKAVAALEKIAQGDMNAKLSLRGKDEFQQVARAIDTVTGTISAMIAEAERLTAAAVAGT